MEVTWVYTVRLRRPLFSVLLSSNDPRFLLINCLCCHPKTPHFLVKYGLFDRSHPKTTYFLHSAATGSYFLFQFHQQIDHFFHFWQFFFLQIPAFKVLTEKIKSNILTQCPLNLNQNLASHPTTPHFLEIGFSPNAQPLKVWALHRYSFDIGVSPPPSYQSQCYLCFERHSCKYSTTPPMRSDAEGSECARCQLVARGLIS